MCYISLFFQVFPEKLIYDQSQSSKATIMRMDGWILNTVSLGLIEWEVLNSTENAYHMRRSALMGGPIVPITSLM